MTEILHHAWLGILAVLLGDPLFALGGYGVSAALVMVAAGFVLGVAVGATPGLAGPMAMAVSLPILISVFGFGSDALLPVMGFLIGVMKGATVGGAVPAILFNTPGTPDAYMTALDGYPLTRQGQAGKALRVAHFSSASGDTFSDLVLILCAPFLAVGVERFLDLPEKTALLLLSLAFVSAAIGGSVGRGLISTGLGLLVAYVGTGLDFHPRLTLGIDDLADGFAPAPVILGVLILGEVFTRFEVMWHARRLRRTPRPIHQRLAGRLTRLERRRLLPHIARSALIGTIIGALPGIGSTLAALLGYRAGRMRQARALRAGAAAGASAAGASGVRADDRVPFGEGAIEGVAAAEAANSSVVGANLIPALSLGIPGNVAAVFLVLAAETIEGFNPGPTAFRTSPGLVNPELVIVFGIFTMMMLANAFNWLMGGSMMRWLAVLSRVPEHILMPFVLLLTLSGIYIQQMRFSAMVIVVLFGALGWGMRRLGITPLPFVIAYILGDRLEDTARQAFSATGGDGFFLFSSPVASLLTLAALTVPAVVFWRRLRAPGETKLGPAM